MSPAKTLLAVLSVCAAALSGPATGDNYPTRTVTIVVPFPAGGVFDVVRPLAQYFGKSWNKSVVIENRPGAAGLIGSQWVAKSTPDGYTLLFVGASVASIKLFQKNTAFDAAKDLAAISMFVDFPSGLVTNSFVPAKNVDEFIAYVKANPGKLNYGSVGPNATMLVIEAFLRGAGIRMTEIPYGGNPQVMVALLRNDVQLGGTPLNLTTKAQVEAGTVRPLLMIGDKRARVFPDVPTSAEKGWNIPRNGWSALFAPAGTPRAIVDFIAAEVARYVSSPEGQKQGLDGGIEMTSSTPDQLQQVVERDGKLWAELAAAVGIKAQ